MDQLNAIWQQVQTFAQQALADAQQLLAQLLADETGRLTAAIVVTAAVALLIGFVMGRPSKAAPAPAEKPRRGDPQAPSSPSAPPTGGPARTGSATGVYRGILEARGVPEDEINGLVRQFAAQIDSFRAGMDRLAGEDSTLKAHIDDARRAIEVGNFDVAVKAVDAVASSHAEVARGIRQQERDRFGLSASALEFIGDLHTALDDFESAARWYRMAIETIPERPASGLISCLNKHGTAAYRGGDHISATSSFDRVRKILEKSLGVDHQDVATALNNLALMYYEQGDYAAAEPLYKRALMIDEQAFGANHPDVATDLNNLALLYMNQGDFDAAEPMFNRSVAIKERHHKLGHPSLVTGLRNYAALLRSMGRPEEAKTLESRAEARPATRASAVSA